MACSVGAGSRSTGWSTVISLGSSICHGMVGGLGGISVRTSSSSSSSSSRRLFFALRLSGAATQEKASAVADCLRKILLGDWMFALTSLLDSCVSVVGVFMGPPVPPQISVILLCSDFLKKWRKPANSRTSDNAGYKLTKAPCNLTVKSIFQNNGNSLNASDR
ncbi:hypothetical protein D3C80_1472180 [compost metagenome]